LLLPLRVALLRRPPDSRGYVSTESVIVAPREGLDRAGSGYDSAVSGPGRNDPCSCGSGRKFKQCCLHALDASNAARLRLRNAEGALIPALFVYAGERFGAEFFAAAWDEFFAWDAVPESFEDSREFGTTFDPFIMFSFVADPTTDLPADWPVEPVAQHFLRTEMEGGPTGCRADCSARPSAARRPGPGPLPGR
jgi:hypothetical protein